MLNLSRVANSNTTSIIFLDILITCAAWSAGRGAVRRSGAGRRGRRAGGGSAGRRAAWGRSGVPPPPSPPRKCTCQWWRQVRTHEHNNIVTIHIWVIRWMSHKIKDHSRNKKNYITWLIFFISPTKILENSQKASVLLNLTLFPKIGKTKSVDSYKNHFKYFFFFVWSG